jgi:DNA-binding Lrp family transcriptional regulator
LDETDFEIIRLLSKDARMSFEKMGKALGIGKDTAFRRFKRLQKEGVILGSTVVLSSKGCGFQGIFAAFVKLEQGKSMTVIQEQLLKTPKVAWLVRLLGEYDFYVELYFRDYGEIRDFMKDLANITGLAKIDPLVYLLEDWPIPIAPFFEYDFPDWVRNNFKTQIAKR